MPKITPFRVMTAIAVVLTAIAVVQTIRASAYERETYERELQVDSLEAVQDSTRELLNLRTDSTRFYQRRVVQSEEQLELMGARIQSLNQEIIAIQDLRLQIDTVFVSADARVEEDSLGTRTAEFRAHEPPVHVLAGVSMSPDSAWADFQITLDPIPISVFLTCEGRSANVTLETSIHAEAEVVSASQTPDVCMPAPGSDPAWWDRFWIGGVSTLGAIIGLAQLL